TPANLAGTLRAHIAAIAIFSSRRAAWLLPRPLLTSSFPVAVKNSTAIAKSRCLGWALCILAGTAAAASRVPSSDIDARELPAGGMIGGAIAKTLQLWLGNIGSYVVVATVALCALPMILRKGVFAPVAGYLGERAKWRPKKPLWWDRYLHKKETAKTRMKDV